MSNSLTNLHVSSPLNILVVEDESIVALDLRSILTYLGYVVVGITGYAEEAVSMVRSLKPDAVMMDIGLRGEMDGVEAAQIIREEMSTPVVFITANADAATLNRAKITEPYGFILKPFDEREIQTTLEMAFFRCKTDQELRESRQWLATTLESIGDAVIATDEQGNVKFMNPIAEKLSGWSQTAAIGRPLPDVFVIVNDSTRNPVPNPVEIVLKEGRTVGLANHTVLIAKDGKEYNIDDAAAPIHDRKGNIIGVVLTFRDITEKYKSEAALHASEKRFRSLIENSEDMITLVDGSGTIVYGSPAVERILGFSFDEYKAHVGFDYIHPDDRPHSVLKFMDLLNKPGETIHIQHRLLHKNGEWVWIEGAVTNLLEDPDIKAIVSNFRDITARKNSEQALTESYTLLKAVTEGTDDVIFVKDIEGRYLLSNSRGKKISGYEPVQMIGKTDIELFPLESAQASMAADRSVIETKANLIVENIVSIAGEKKIYMTSKNPLYNNEGEIIGVVGVARDITELKNAQEDLRKKEELFRAMIEDSADGVSLTSKEGKIIYSSPANPKILGYTPDERLNGGFADLLHPDDAPRVTAMFQGMMTGATDAERFEIRARHKDSKWHWLEVNCRNMVSNPSVNAIVSNFRDITARKDAEQALQENYGLLKAMTESTGDVIFMKDIEGRYIFINAAGAKISSKTKEEIIGKTDEDLFDAEIAKMYRDVDTLVIKTERGYSQEYDSIVDGQVHNFITSKNPIRDANKKVIGTVGISRDITELKNAQKDLHQKEELFRAMIEDSNNGVLLIDTESKLVYSSPANEKILGYSAGERLGKNFDDLVHPQDTTKAGGYIQELIAGKNRIEPFELQVQHKDGSWRWLEATAMNMLDNPNVNAIVVNFHDITRRTVAAEKLFKSEQTLSDIVEAITVPMMITGIESKKNLYGNQLVAGMLGIPLEELYSQKNTLDFYVNQEDRDSAARQLLETGSVQNMLVLLRRGNEETFWGVITSRIITFGGEQSVVTTVFDISDQKKAEEEVVKSNERFEMIANATDDVVWDWSLDDNSIWWNKNFYEHLGYDEKNKDLTINSWLNGLHPVDKERVTLGIHAAIDSGENYWSDEYRFLKADGNEVFVLDRGYILYNSNGKPYRMVGAMVDITDHKRNEEKVKENEEKYRLMFDHNPQPMWIYDSVTLKFLEVNDAALIHYGYSRDEFLAMSIKDIRPEEDIPLLIENLQSPTTNYNDSGEWRHLKKNGEVITVQITSHVIKHNGLPARHVLINDISSRKKTEQALHENYTLLKTITEGINESIFAKDALGNYTFVNSTAAKTINKTKEEVIGNDDTALFSANHAAWLKEIDHAIIETKKSHSFEGYMSEGAPHYFIDTRYPIFDDNTGEVVGIVGISRDISDRKKAEEKLHLYERALQNAAEGIVIVDSEHPDNPTVFANDGFYKMTGYSPEEVIGKNRDYLQGKNTDKNVELEIRNRISDQTSFKGEILNYKKDGTPFWNFVRTSPVPNESGKVTHFIGLLTDIDDRKKSESKLRLYERALQSVNDGIIITDAEQPGNPTIYANDAFYTMTGYSPVDVLGKNRDYLLGKATDTNLDIEIRNCIVENRYFKGEILNYKKDGTAVWNFLHLSPVPNENGEVTHFIGLHIDISERKKAEAKLRLYERALQSAAEGIIITESGQMDELVIFANEGFYDMTGYGPYEVLGKNCRFLQGSDTDKKLVSEIRHCITEKRYFEGEILNYKKDGTPFWNFLRIAPVPNEEGEVTHYVGFQNDISERKLAEDLIHSSQMQLAEAQRLAKYGNWNYDCLSDALTWSEELYNVFGTDKNTFIETHGSFVNLVDKADRGAIIETNDKAMIDGQPFSIVYQITTPTGEKRFIEEFGQGEKDETGKVIRLFGTAQNITERKIAEQKIKESEEKYRALVENSPDIIITLNRDYNLQFINRTVEGMTKEEVVGQNAFNFIAPEYHELARQTFKKVYETKSVQNYEVAGPGPSGSVAWYITHAGPIFSGEDVIGITLVTRDITARKIAEEEIRNNEKNLHQIIEAITVPMVVTSIETGKVKYANQLVAEMLAVPMEDVLEQQAEDYYKDPEDRKIVIGLIKKHGFVKNYLLQLRRSTGEFIWVLFSGGIITFDGEQALVVTMYDISEQKKAEDKLRESEELFRAMIENSTDGVTLIDSTGVLTYMSPNGEKIIGTNVEELNALGFLTYIHPDDRDAVNEKFEKLLAGIEFEPTDLRWNHKGKQWKWVQTRGANLVDNSSIRSIIMNFRDITEQKKADEELIISQARLSGVIDSAMDAIITISDNYNIVLFNKAAEKMFCCEAEEVLGSQIERFIPLRFRDTHSQSIATFGRGGITNRAMGNLGVLNGLRTTGEEFPIEASISQIDSVAGKLYTVILRDVTERRKAERQLLEQAALLEIVPDAIIMRELSGKVIYWNLGAARMYGWTAAEAIGKSVLDLISNRESSSFFEMQKILLEKDEWSGEFIQLTKTKQKILVQSRWKLVRNHEGEPTSVLVTNTDITEKRNLEQQFLRAQRLESIGTLASGIAHDLNNILTPVVLGMELVKTKIHDDASLQRIDTIIGIVKRGSGLISQVLDFARGTKGENVPINSKYIVMEVAKVIRETFPRQIDIDVNITKEDVTVIGDGTQIHQVLMNLCINARDAMPGGGKLDISVALETTDESIVRQNINAKIGRYVVISVRDSGEGIPPEIRDRIFDPFFTTKAEGKGTGLGLATVFTIVKNHGGFINLYSEVGNGTSFKIYLPVHISAQAAEVEEEVVVRGSGKQELILVVDDEELIRTISADILIENGYAVLTAHNGADAARIYRERKDEISAIVTDVMMPIMNGIELIEIVQGINPDAKIVAASGLMQGDIASKLAVAKVSARLTKPFTADKLLAAVHHALYG